MKALAILLGGLVIIFLAGAYGTIVGGLIVYKYYQWFFHIAFPTINYTMTFTQGIAISFLVWLFKNHDVNELKDDYKDKGKKYSSLFVPWLALLLGWILYLFIR